MTSSLPRYVYEIRDQHGKVRYRFRRRGWASRYISGEPGSPEFLRQLAAILERGPRKPAPITSPTKATHRSLDDLFAHMKRSPRWMKKADVTRHTQGLIYQRFLNRVGKSGRRFGERPVSAVTLGWLDTILGEMWETPGAANDLRKKLRALLEYGVALRWIDHNPVKHTMNYKSGEGFHSWSEEEINQFRAYHAIGTMPRFVMELALNTAARRGTIAKLTRDSLVKNRIIVAHSKGGKETSVPMLATTRAAFKALPAAPINYLVTNQRGKPYSAASLGNMFRRWCDEAGLVNCSIHGLRKALSRRVAEAGGTDAEGMAITGHTRPSTFAQYRATANREALSDAAMTNLTAKFE